MLIRDFQEPVRSMVDGRHYTSKRHYRDHLKAHGMVELGNEVPQGHSAPPAISERDIADAYDQCAAGHGAKVSDKPPEGWQGSIEECIE